jgi:hypothetical protein
MAPKAPSQPHSLVRDSLRQAVCQLLWQMQLQNASGIHPLGLSKFANWDYADRPIGIKQICQLGLRGSAYCVLVAFCKRRSFDH